MPGGTVSFSVIIAEILTNKAFRYLCNRKLLEYLIQNDGSVVCKWCGEVLPSRTRWYRHKYKLHVSTQVTQPAPLFKCHSCNAYFKSRKGYIGHLSSRHSDNENDENREEPTNKKTRRTSDVSLATISSSTKK